MRDIICANSYSSTCRLIPLLGSVIRGNSKTICWGGGIFTETRPWKVGWDRAVLCAQYPIGTAFELRFVLRYSQSEVSISQYLFH